MIYDLNYLTDFLIKYRMTPNQFLLCWILHLADRKKDELGFYAVVPPGEEDGLPMANYYKLIRESKETGYKWIRKSEINDLKQRGYIRIPERADDPYNLSLASTTEKFTEGLMVTKNQFEELWKIYPDRIPNFKHPSGPDIKLKSCVYPEVEELYWKFVHTNKLHQSILDAVEWGKENNEINQNIKNFVGGRNWETLFKQMEEGESSTNRTIL